MLFRGHLKNILFLLKTPISIILKCFWDTFSFLKTDSLIRFRLIHVGTRICKTTQRKTFH